ncbi:YDG/SRA domain-containing protein [Streptomyces sp. TRM75563]|uniref:YDG/SRA domain-containing protein n=1 Tax=Streptomyces sp. TRM75563 TaxID=2817418 RepID=UPI001F617B3D|nr:YDG/SRA domain-containing protein [Streptomyces sp. TRM75563]MCI4045610.1 HNH endonuclease [Streptomyces sp. TRM75563]
MIGEVANVRVGQVYSTRRMAHEAGVHRPLQAGICGTMRTGAESIVVSGGYKDDEDYGDVIVYTGHGGQDDKRRQVRNQSLDDPGNAALITSYLEGLPVRVLRGYQGDASYAPASGYRYDGLYRVTSYGSKLGIDGFLIWQFRLEAYDDTPLPQTTQQSELPSTSGKTESHVTGNENPERVTSTVQRIVRSSAVKRQVKQWHDNRCQICNLRIEVPGGSYSEGAHIRALGAPHNGPDTTGNVLCLCPNCHVELDAGAIVIEDDLTVILDGQPAGIVRTDPRHIIDLECVRHHRERWRQ